MSLSIGQAADKSGCTPATIRYYESIGLLPPTPRSDAGRRAYGSKEVAVGRKRGEMGHRKLQTEGQDQARTPSFGHPQA